MLFGSKIVRSMALLVMSVAFCTPLYSAGPNRLAKGHVEYSRDPGTLLVAYREIYPEFADQDPTPLIRIYGDGRVVVFHPSYMKQAGLYEMMMSRSELENVLLELAPALMGFDTADIKRQKKAANELLWAAANHPEDVTIFYDADAEISVFYLNIDSFRPKGFQGETLYTTGLEKSWRGLRFDAKDYPGIEPIQTLMRAQNILKALASRGELVLVGPAQ